MLYLALFLLILAFFFFRKSSVQRKEAGIPGGRIIYSDTRGWGKLEQPLFYAALELTGKPDYLVEQGDKIIPVEVKSGRAPEAPYDSHVYQLAAYCLLVEKTYHKRPPYGIIHYEGRDFAIDYTRELEQSLIDLLVEMKRDELHKNIPRSHESPARCAKCGYRDVCDQKL
jgi:CRISPR-associated exonuclease Cas4